MTCPTSANRTYLSPPPKKIPGNLVAYIASRCQARERDAYVEDLMRYIKVDSFGICLHNKDMPGEKMGDWPRKWDLKIHTMGYYKFGLAFENTNLTDWVTEKLPHVVLSGAVPIYMGADNVDEYLPGPHSVIKTSDFASPQKLAEYLIELDKDDAKYNEYFEWKKKGMSPNFKKFMDDCGYFLDKQVCNHFIAEQQEERRVVEEQLGKKIDWPVYPTKLPPSVIDIE